VRQVRKEKIINSIRSGLLESVVAEKSAVLATTDEESQALALEVQGFATLINQLRDELRSLVVIDGNDEEIEKLDAFDSAWSELGDVDRRLLALAVANTNLKAARLSAQDGASALDRFVDTLTELQIAATDVELIRKHSQVSVAALRVQSLLLVHIPSADEEEMTRLEQQIQELSSEVELGLQRIRELSPSHPDQLATATQAWRDYQNVGAVVLRLSRENSNVISFDVSVHEKQQATKACLHALSALSAVMESRPRATR